MTVGEVAVSGSLVPPQRCNRSRVLLLFLSWVPILCWLNREKIVKNPKHELSLTQNFKL